MSIQIKVEIKLFEDSKKSDSSAKAITLARGRYFIGEQIRLDCMVKTVRRENGEFGSPFVSYPGSPYENKDGQKKFHQFMYIEDEKLKTQIEEAVLGEYHRLEGKDSKKEEKREDDNYPF